MSDWPSVDVKKAQLLRSYADTERTVTLLESAAGRQIRIAFEDAYPSPPRTTVVSIPIAKDDLDVTRAQLPLGLKAAIFKR